MAAKIVRFHHVPGTSNPADILSKHWDTPSVWPQLKPILFWKGDTAEIENYRVAGQKEVEEVKPDVAPNPVRGE